jgi:two-component system response regulator (stage 0 sporulation protein A)
MATDLIKVLVVDDNKDLTSIISRLFTQYADIVPMGAANNGQEALAMIRKGKIDVVLLDIIMPGMDGMQVLEQIMQMEDKRPAVIILSAMGSNDMIKRVLELGADYFLVKPVEASVMIEKIRLAHRKRRGLRLAKVDIG